MSEQVEKYISELEENLKLQRGEELMFRGVFEKEYSDHQSPEYPCVEGKGKDKKFYKKVLLEVSQEEYESITHLTEQLKCEVDGGNRTAQMLRFSGYGFMIAGTIISVSLNASTYGTPGSVILEIGASLFAGLLLVGLSELLDLLQKLANKR